MKKLLFFLSLTALIVACNKNQKAVKVLEGSWSADKMEVTYVVLGTSLTKDIVGEGGSAIFSFTRCKLKDVEWCDFSMDIHDAVADTTYAYSGFFRVVSDGKLIETKETDSTGFQVIGIDELTKSNLKINYVSDELGGPVVAEFSR